MGVSKRPNVLARVVENELGTLPEGKVCVGIVGTTSAEVFEDMGGYTLIELPESSLCGGGLVAVCRQPREHPVYERAEAS